MVRGRRRRLPGAQSAVRWVAADARDVARIHGSSAGPAVAFPDDVSVATVEGGLARWQRRVERRRLLAVGRRGALLGVAAACLLQLGALASGNDGSGLWLLPAALPAVAAVAFGLAHRTSPAAAARLLDRDLALAAGVSTALELETSAERAASGRGLGALVLADVRGAIGRSLPGARARLQPRRRETALLAALVAALAALLLVPSPRTATPAATAAAPQPNAVNRALRADNGVPGAATPRAVPACRAACRRSSMHRRSRRWRPRGSGARAMRRRRAAVMALRRGMRVAGGAEQTSGVAGQAGVAASADGSDGTSQRPGEGTGQSELEDACRLGGRLCRERAGRLRAEVAERPPAAARAAPRMPPVTRRSPASRRISGRRRREHRRLRASPARRAARRRAAAARPRRTRHPAAAGASVPGGAAAGDTAGEKGAGAGVVPELRGGARLPLSPTYEAVPGAEGTTAGSTSSKAGGAGGSGRSGQASGRAGSGGAAGVAWVPPGGDDRRLERPRHRARVLRLARARELERLVT